MNLKPFPVEQGPPLYADVPVALRAQNSENIGVPLRGGFCNLIAGFECCSTVRHAGASLSNRTPIRKSLPADVRAMFTEQCAPSRVVVLPLGDNRCEDGLIIPVCEAVSAKCAESFDGWLRAGFKPHFDYAHIDNTLAADVLDVYHCPTRGTVAVVAWHEWAQKEICEGSCDSLSPRLSIGEDLEIEGFRDAIGGLLHRTMTAAIPALQGSLKPISKLEDFVFLATHFRRRLGELQRSGVADPEANLAPRMPRAHAAFTRFSELENEFGPQFYMTHS